MNLFLMDNRFFYPFFGMDMCFNLLLQLKHGWHEQMILHLSMQSQIFLAIEYIEKNGITDIRAHLKKYVDEYNRTCPPYKKIGVLKVRTEDFPKNTLRKIMRFKLDMSID